MIIPIKTCEIGRIPIGDKMGLWVRPRISQAPTHDLLDAPLMKVDAGSELSHERTLPDPPHLGLKIEIICLQGAKCWNQTEQIYTIGDPPLAGEPTALEQGLAVQITLFRSHS
jgi:hypothetical protein